MTQDLQLPNGDFLRYYPEVTRVEVITNIGRKYVQHECSNVNVSLQDDGQTIKVFLFSTYD
jgi:septum formation topological specificity factor MinE